jgi:hypothetical protein
MAGGHINSTRDLNLFQIHLYGEMQGFLVVQLAG